MSDQNENNQNQNIDTSSDDNSDTLNDSKKEIKTETNSNVLLDESEKKEESNTVDEINIKLNTSSEEARTDNELKTSIDDVKPEKAFPTLPFAIRRPFIKEKPKVVLKKDDDIEEFDTDEEEENVSHEEQYKDFISYEGDKCIYTEPGSGRRLVWNSKENKWCPDKENQEDLADGDPMKSYEFDGKHYVYTDKTSNITYKFNQDKNEWVVKDDKEDKTNTENVPSEASTGGVYGFENDTHTYTDPNDGSMYVWDREKNAWFPKVDDDFMARYQMSYGFTEDSGTINSSSALAKNETAKTQKLSKEEKKAENKRKNQEPATWFDVDEAHNTTIYIANLPLDVTMEEVKELVTKCGLLARDEKGKDKLKLYTDSNGEAKGDARCTYIKVESVGLALDILDGWQLRDKTLSVQRATFQMKGQYDPTLKPKRKKKDKEKQKKIHEKLFDWRPDRMRGEPLKCERVVIIKNLFKPEDFDQDVTLLLEYQQDVRSECAKCGEVKKVTIYDRHPEGVAQVTFKETEEAQACIQLLHGRWFGQRKITAEIWDGKTKYKIRETEEQIEARINKWDKYLEDKEETEKSESTKKTEKSETMMDTSQSMGTSETPVTMETTATTEKK